MVSGGWPDAASLCLPLRLLQWRRLARSLRATPPDRRSGSSAGGLGWLASPPGMAVSSAFASPCSAAALLPALAAPNFLHCCAARRPKAAKAEIRLTPGKGLQDLTCSVEELVDQVVKGCKVGGNG